MKQWIVCYDISSQKRRYQVDKLLSGYGDRIQYSVFLCRLTDSEYQHVRRSISMHITMEDRVNYYPQCVWCIEKQHWQGVKPHILFDGYIQV